MTIRSIDSDVSFDDLVEKLKALDGVQNMKVYSREEWLGDDVDVGQLPPQVRQLRMRELNKTQKPIPDNVTPLGQRSK